MVSCASGLDLSDELLISANYERHLLHFSWTTSIKHQNHLISSIFVRNSIISFSKKTSKLRAINRGSVRLASTSGFSSYFRSVMPTIKTLVVPKMGEQDKGKLRRV